MKFDHKQYVPCFRWKQGEYQAVMRIPDEGKELLMPLIEAPEMGFDFENRKDAKTIDEHIAPLARRLCDKWGVHPFFLDLNHISKYIRMQQGNHPAAFIFQEIAGLQCSAIPVIRVGDNGSYQQEIRRIFARIKQRDLCVRLTLTQLAKNSVNDDLDGLLVDFKASLDECHLILDLGAPNFIPLEGLVQLIQVAVGRVKSLKHWKTFTMISTSFPETMGGLHEGLQLLPRYEWQLYKKLIPVFGEAKLRLPAFGDYGISYPGTPQMDMRITKPSATIRYAVDDQWCIVKGKNTRDYKFDQYHGLCSRLVKSSLYCGPGFSYGDEYIKKCADKKIKPGNLSTWRQVGTSHHVAKVTHDIANFYGSLKSR